MTQRQSRVYFSSKNPTPIFSQSATPELPLLEEAASELAGFDDLQLLPSAAIDCEQPWGNEWTPATTLPASPDASRSDGEDSEADRDDVVAGEVAFWPCEPKLCVKNSFLEFDVNDGKASESRARAASDFTGMQVLESQGVVEVLLADLSLPSMSLKQASVSVFDTSEQPCRGTYCPMWCLVEEIVGVQRVTPVCEGMMRGPPNDGGNYTNLWCWTETRADGVNMIVPLTDKGLAESVAQVDLAWMPEPISLTDAAVVGCAPAAASADAHEPDWHRGPVWPFNADPTTLMLSNLPTELNQEDLLEVLDREEFNGYYDFVFLPEDDLDQKNGRYAIVNLIAHEYGRTLAARLHGKTRWGVYNDAGPCGVTWALPYQGLADLVRVYRDMLENEPEVPSHLRPQIFSRGWPVEFPDISEAAAQS